MNTNKQNDIDDTGIDVYEKELMKLRQWRDEIGIPAQQQNEQFQIVIQQLEEQNKVLASELKAYHQEVDKLKNEKKDLSQELQTTMERSNSNILQVQGTDTKLFEMKQRCDELEWKTLEHEETIDELKRNNNALKKESQQYQMILDKLQKEEMSLKHKMRKESTELHELQQKYNVLDGEYLAQISLNKKTSVFAEELQSELVDYKNIRNPTLINEKTKRMGHFDDLDYKDIKSEHEYKTLHNGPHSLRFCQIKSNSVQPDSLGFYQSDSIRNDEPFVQIDTFGGIEESMKEIKEQLQIEYDERLSKEKEKWIGKHQSELSELNVQIVHLKKTLILKDNELKVKNNERDEEDNTRRESFGWGLMAFCKPSSNQ